MRVRGEPLDAWVAGDMELTDMGRRLGIAPGEVVTMVYDLYKDRWRVCDEAAMASHRAANVAALRVAVEAT